MTTKEQAERIRINVMEFYPGMSLERFQTVFSFFVESNSEAIEGRLETNANGELIAPLYGRTLFDAYQAARTIQEKNPELPFPPRDGYGLQNWARDGLSKGNAEPEPTKTKKAKKKEAKEETVYYRIPERFEKAHNALEATKKLAAKDGKFDPFTTRDYYDYGKDKLISDYDWGNWKRFRNYIRGYERIIKAREDYARIQLLKMHIDSSKATEND